ncbi:MAG: adenine phosphoribosyltransferase [Candidatus Micrarchaeota archaeon]|nr:adenine phosphoribosyltransferase [Candidatus Micrarchaeota archaeon]MDE1848300.1 adenine phosphoribosyltransferase [Candidatus Micrarchaeota archaeon]MDE1864753.1 adenine phosphoribosyltransferase [Candidatus Micrarchaeota archaeon]
MPAEHVLKYTGQKSYTLEVSGLRRELPLISVGNGTWIAFFESLGDVELINKSAQALSKELGECEILMTSESKGISLLQQIGTILGHKTFIVCRKERKGYMREPLSVRYKPITSPNEKELFLDSNLAALLKGKKVGIVDDVVSTRATLDAMAVLAQKAGGIVVKKAVILAEGSEQEDVISLGILPIFKK